MAVEPSGELPQPAAQQQAKTASHGSRLKRAPSPRSPLRRRERHNLAADSHHNGMVQQRPTGGCFRRKRYRFYEPRGVEAVEPGKPRIGIGEMAGQGAQVAVFGDELAAAENLGGGDRHAPHARLVRQQVGDDVPRLPRARASRCNRPACRPAWSAPRRVRSSGAASAASLAMSAGLLEPRHVGMAADGAGRGAGRIEQHGVERLGRSIRRRRRRRARLRATTGSGFPAAAASRAGARSTAVTRAPAAASCAVLPPGAAQRSATRSPRDVAEQPRRQRRRRVLHPPGALGKARQRGDGAMRDRAHRAGRQHAAAEPRRPQFGIALHRQIERRLRGHWRRRWRGRSPRRRSRSSAPSAIPACRARPCRARPAARRPRARAAAARR